MKIKVSSIEFGQQRFRKLENLRIEVADRLTVIAGHNGIGKSTILGLLANTFGVRSVKSYFGEAFNANIEKIVYLALDEVAPAQEDPSAAPSVVATVGGVEVRKRCALTLRDEWQRARVVPRTVSKLPGDPVGQDAKIPLPTIYLGIRRIASIGEADDNDITYGPSNMDVEDGKLLMQFVGAVISGIELNSNITEQRIKSANKRSAHPGYSHTALAVSVGQDSLGSIATALASFNQLKREMGDNYPGGLLVIDELDIGFHPHAIDRLVDSLKKFARKLDLQIIATTHSPRLLERVHPEGAGNKNAPDAVAYLLDTLNPRLADDQSLEAILDDMAQRHDIVEPVRAVKPLLCVYFEDPESLQMCEEWITPAVKRSFNKKYGVRLKFIALSIPGSNMVALPEKDPLFKDRVLVVDGDTTVSLKAKARGNTVKLPCPKGSSGTDRSPENMTKIFLHQIASARRGPLAEARLRLKVSNPSSDKIGSLFFSDSSGNSSQRDSAKSWWNVHWKHLKSWGVIPLWAECHPAEMVTFLETFELAIAKTSKRVKAGQPMPIPVE